jgi:hypothetical protein
MKKIQKQSEEAVNLEGLMEEENNKTIGNNTLYPLYYLNFDLHVSVLLLQ